MKDLGYEYTQCQDCGKDLPIHDGRYIPELCHECEERRADEERERWESSK